MKILKQSVGIDLSMDDFKVAFGALTNTLECQFQMEKTYHNSTTGINSFIKEVKKWITQPSVHFIMEATGVYHEKLANTLYRQGFQVAILLPNKAKSFIKSINQRAKTDEIDARLLSQMGLERNLECWKPASPIFIQLRALTRERSSLIEERSILKNKYHAIEHSNLNSSTTKRRLNQRIRLINKQVASIEVEIKSVIASQDALKEKTMNIQSVKGLSVITIATILAETNGFALIRNRKQLIGYSGLDVQIHQSGKKMKKGRISKKGNSHIRKALYMPALNACRSNQLMKVIYNQLGERQAAKKQAVIVIEKKLLLLIYTLWKNNTPYDPEKNVQNRLALSTV